MNDKSNQLISKIGQIEQLNFGYQAKILSLVGIIYNQMEVLAHHQDQEVCEIANQTQYPTEILKGELNIDDFELVEDIRRMIEKKSA